MSAARHLARTSFTALGPVSSASAVVCAIALAASLAAACGPKKPSPEPMTPSNDEVPPSTETGAAAGGDADAGAGAGGNADAASPAADLTPVTVSCIASAVCSELVAPGPEAQAAKEKCVAGSGEAHDGGCSHDGVIATCLVESKGATLYYYRDKDPETTKGRLIGGKNACTNAGGTFTPVSSKTDKKSGKKPKKK
jgi:hypothetical protein